MEWINLKDKTPNVNQKVLIFTQGYSKTDKPTKDPPYYYHYQIAYYVMNPRDKRQFSFVDAVRWENELDGGNLYNVWQYSDVTHWMPLPEPPEKISVDDYIKIAKKDAKRKHMFIGMG